MKRKKVLILGVDGLDPGLTNRFRSEGIMPNFDKFIARGSSGKDLVMLGGVPTITPPMWTTLATGATPATHGITCFWGQSKTDMATMTYNLNSMNCKAEQLWNVTTAAGLKTLVWHWPGSSWPPSSQSELLHVVDGTQPNAIGNGDCVVDDDKLVYASVNIEKVLFQAKVPNTSGAGCVINDVPVEKSDDVSEADYGSALEMKSLILSEHEGDMSADMLPIDIVNSPITEPVNWESEVPSGAKEMTILVNNGMTRRPALILCNADGKYDRVAVYKNKKAAEPMAVLADKMVSNVLDELSKEDAAIKVNRHMRLLDIAEDGSEVRLWFGAAKDIEKDVLWHPKYLKKSVVEAVGPVPGTSMSEARNESLVKSVLLPCWDIYTQWQSDALHHLIATENYDIIFSHLHNVDACGHLFWYLAKDRVKIGNNGKLYEDAIEWAYRQTDRYLGSFLHLLDEGWTILVVSDHGLLCPPEDDIPLLGDGFGCNIRVLEELGYTVLKRDENGNELREVDYSKTRAVANRGNHIHINLKGRQPHGIVEPEDKYNLETQIINDLYSYRNADGKRIVSIALRNKDAAILGLTGEECGDILYWLEEGYNRLHGDSLPTFQGMHGTTVSPVFIAAGPGIKENYETTRTIRSTDVAPTVAVLLDVPMPKDCEGAPVYQIFAE
ncbi:MAG: alkaline phosphatase family protein [Peptococcaceae bacterium]|nr:alkaline phosphatase family protein [Peptococcaceae bacterium]